MPEARAIPQILWSKGPSHVPPGFHNTTQNFGADGRLSSFSALGSHSHHLVYLEKLFCTDCLSQISSGLHFNSPYWYVLAPDPKPTTAFNRILPQIAQSHKCPGSSQILCTRIVTRTTKPSLSSCRNSKRTGSVLPSLFSPHDSAISDAEPL